MPYMSIDPLNLDHARPREHSRRRRSAVPAILLTLAVACWFSLLVTPGTARAYTLEQRDEPVTEEFLISPTKTELVLQPGQSTVREVTVVNRTGMTIKVSLSVEDFEGSLDPAESHRLLGDGDSAWGARRWMEPELDSIELQQGETLRFDVRITAPSDAEPGGHYAAVIAKAEEPENADASSVVIKGRVTSLMLITVPGDVDSRGELEDPEVPLLASFGPTTIGLVFNNLGNVHQSPSGMVTITNLLGQQVAEIPVDEWVVLPESSRRTQIEWPGKWHLGPYKVLAQITYGEDGETIYATSTVWFIPWQIILVSLAAAFIILFMIAFISRRRRLRRREVEDELEQLRAFKEGTEEARPEAEPEAAPAPEEAEAVAEHPPVASELVPLNQLLPSTEDARLVDISDQETRQLIRELINNEMELARMYIIEGKHEMARKELLEARAAALRIKLLAEVAMIDDLLNYL